MVEKGGPSAATTRKRSGLRETLDYLLWLYTPFKKMCADQIYDLFSTRTVSGHGLYMNLGYWKDADDVDQACEALVALVGKHASLGPGQRVLDVGFGFAEQDMYWLEQYHPERIVGINITSSQVEFARRRVAERRMSDRIELLAGNAVALPFGDQSFDRVLGVECAFHFRTRERFLQEAFRVLKPGGQMVLADIIAAPRQNGLFRRLVHWSSWRAFSSRWDLPPENIQAAGEYRHSVAEAGFSRIAIDSIRDHVFGPLHQKMASDPSILQRFHPLVRFLYRIILKLGPLGHEALDYVIVVADKPH